MVYLARGYGASTMGYPTHHGWVRVDALPRLSVGQKHPLQEAPRAIDATLDRAHLTVTDLGDPLVRQPVYGAQHEHLAMVRPKTRERGLEVRHLRPRFLMCWNGG